MYNVWKTKVRSLKAIIIFILLLMLAISANSQYIYKNRQQREAAFRLVLHDELRQIYDQIIDPADKEKWEQKYWKILDPTPDTENNEFYNEFIDRFKHAKKYYSNLITPLYLDDRGKYYLKYGEPDDKALSYGVGKPYRDNETWVYYDYNLFFDFVSKPGFGFREVNNLMEAIKPGPSSYKVPIAAELYVERESLHPRYLTFREIADGTAELLAEGTFYQLTEELNGEKRLALETAPPVRHSFSHEKERLDARLASAVFRGEYGNSKVELYYSLPLNQLNFEHDTQIPLASFVEKQLTIYNQDFDKVLHKKEGLKIGARNQREIEKRIYINQHTEELPPGLYNIALQLDSPESKRLAILRAQLSVKDFSDDRLMISDIQFSPQIREGISNQRNLKPNNLLIVPYIGNTIRKINPIYVYFEIYNLTLNQESKSRFRVTYEVRSFSTDNTSAFASAIQFISHLIGNKPEEKIGSSFESEGQAEFQQIYLMIDFSKFPSGPCLLTISVTDLENAATVSGQKRMVLK